MDAKEFTVEIFLKDVKNHSLEIIKNDGYYRHICCSDNGNFNQKFDIVTWPNYLAITGDMGDYVFSRVIDMFSFFRNDKLEINSAYWAEKVTAESVFGNGIREFSVDEFREAVVEHACGQVDVEHEEQLPEEVKEEIEHILDSEDEFECVQSIRDFDSDLIDFDDFWERSVKRKTYHYIWCCHAIVWAIQKYDKQTSGFSK